MPTWSIVLVIVLVVASFGVAVLPNEIRVWRATRRGGLLELHSPGARAAMADMDDWFGVEVVDTVERSGSRTLTVAPLVASNVLLEHGAAAAYVEGVSPLRRCNPAKKTHYHGAGERCQCGERPNVLPFAGGGAA